MSYKIKYIAQLYNTKTKEIVKEQEIYKKNLKLPNTFDEFGLRHKEQIKLIKKSQDFMLEQQCECFENQTRCPKCGRKLRKQGLFESEFHDVYTDHKLQIQRLSCTCGWKSKSTISGLYGSASHPELVKLQVITGATSNSFKKASNILNTFCGSERTINNDVTIMRNVNKIGKILAEHKKSDEWCNAKTNAAELIIVADGGHVQDKEKNKHSFEEMICTVYKPEDVIVKAKDSRRIKDKICVASAKKDGQRSIKKLSKNACKKSGMTQETKITALTDGANNCWSIINDLSSECGELEKVLDWFHIGKKFKERESKIPSECRDKYDKAKWHLWHGHPDTSIIRLNQIKQESPTVIVIEKIDELIRYITNNKDNIVSYHARRLKGLTYTSQLAESSVNSVINERQKNRQMRWTRNGAHNILQIRTSLFSNIWNSEWKFVANQIYKKIA